MEQVEGFMVFWMQVDEVFADRHMRASARHFEMNEMSAALQFMEALRKEGRAQFVSMASQTAHLVGKAGATGVANGKLPNGDTYTYTKGDALSQRTKTIAPVAGTDAVEVLLDDE